MRTFANITLVALLFVACNNTQSDTNADSKSSTDSLTMNKLATDTSKMLVAELPLYFDSTDYLIHSIGFIHRNNYSGSRSSDSFYSSDARSNDFSFGRYSNDYFSGNISNLVFENIKTAKQTMLTDKVLNIMHIQYIREVAQKTKRHYILYQVFDADANHDGLLYYGDISTLYISTADGANFKKLTKEGHQYNSGKLIIQNLKYYFKTIEGVDNAGTSKKHEKYHYYYIDFSNDDYKIVEYNPLELVTR